MTNRLFVAGWALFIFLSPSAIQAQTLPAPKGGNAFFGAPQGQAFNADTAFQGIPKPVAAAPPPAVIPDSPDGGLLPAPPPPPRVNWTGSADLGINGASGNSNLFNLRTNFNAVRKTAGNVLTTDFLYQLTQQEGAISTNQALLNARDEHLFEGTPWSLFSSLNLEYDELREYDFRVGVYGGTSYAVVARDDLTLKLRAGAGAVREIATRDPLLGPGGVLLADAPSRWTPEFVLGYDFRYAVNDRSSFLSIMDYYPRIDDFTKYRVRFRAAYEVMVDPVSCTILRLGVQDRYDSDAGLSKKNDLTYFATIGFKF